MKTNDDFFQDSSKCDAQCDAKCDAQCDTDSQYTSFPLSLLMGNINLFDLLRSEECQRDGLYFALGRDDQGKDVFANLDDMPNLLVAGATGSGKSVFLNCLIVSLMYRYSPQQLRFILVDPKDNEFSVYENSPHMLVPKVITQPEQCLSAISWLVDEIESRYNLFLYASVRNIEDYNSKINKNTTKPLQRIVLIVDELNDLMTYDFRSELDAKVKTICQKARAAGIHLVFATHRPDAEILTGVIRANFTSRVALKVCSALDSKMILNAAGAENLVGKGDMLYLSAYSSNLQRLKGAYIGLRDIENVVDYITNNNQSCYDEIIASKILRGKCVDACRDDEDQLDPLFVPALKYCIEQDTASITVLQRVFQIGFIRAGRLIEVMKNKNFIASRDGAKTQKVIITMEEFIEIYGDITD